MSSPAACAPETAGGGASHTKHRKPQKDTVTRKTEPYVVDSVSHIGDSLALVSSGGVVICRVTNEFARIPQRGDHLTLESLDGFRITGLIDGDDYLFHYTDADLAAQDRRAHDDAVKAQKAAAQQKEDQA